MTECRNVFVIIVVIQVMSFFFMLHFICLKRKFFADYFSSEFTQIFKEHMTVPTGVRHVSARSQGLHKYGVRGEWRPVHVLT